MKTLHKPQYTLDYFQEVSGIRSEVFLNDAYLDHLKKLSPSFSMLDKANSFFYLFDFTGMKYLYVSENIQKVLGYSAENWRTGGPGFAFSIVHPDDVQRLKESHKALFRFYYAQKPEHRRMIRYGYETRVLAKDGREVWILQQGSFIEIDEEGKPGLSFDVTADTTDCKKDKSMSLALTNDETNEKMVLYFPVAAQSVFSEREVEIMRLLAKNFSSKQVAERLSISVHTVDTHRRNMIKKGAVK